MTLDSPTVGSYEGGGSYERGTPVAVGARRAARPVTVGKGGVGGFAKQT